MNISQTDLLTKLTSNLEPFCDFCGNKCGNEWYLERNRKNKDVSTTTEETTRFLLCVNCLDKNNFPSLYIKSDFKKKNIMSHIKENSKSKYWSVEKSLQVLKLLKDVNFNLFKLKETLNNQDSEFDIVLNILRIPFEYFKNFNKISTKNFEIIFKKSESNPKEEEIQHSPLINHIAFLRLLIDYTCTEDEDLNESFVLHDTVSNQYKYLHGNSKYPTNSLVEKIVQNNKPKIIRILKKFKTNSKFLIKKTEKKILEKIQEINYLQFQKFENTQKFIGEYEKYLLNQRNRQIERENNLLVDTYLKKRNLNELH